MDVFDTYYYDQDHLGNIRQVTDKSGKAVQTTDYYPFGMQLCDGTTSNFDQKHKYNGQGSCQRVQTSSLSMPSAAEAQPKVKEFDTMHGLNTFDYGARQYNPVTARWDRMDPLCEKYYSVSPYAYCANNPVKFIDPDGMRIGDYYDMNGMFLASDGINDGKKYMVLDKNEVEYIKQTNNVSNVSSRMNAPTNTQVDKGQQIIDKGKETQLEVGFVMGEGKTSGLVTGERSSIKLGEQYNNVPNPDSDAHYQPLDVRDLGEKGVAYSTSEPSSADKTMRKVREENGLNKTLNPSWVIGEELNGNFTRNSKGELITPSTTTSIRFIRNGNTSAPIKWETFKNAVYKINGK